MIIHRFNNHRKRQSPLVASPVLLILFTFVMATKSASSEASPEWTILYHQPGKLKGRGEFLRLMLEDKGISYVNTDANLFGPEGWMDGFRGSPEAVKTNVKEVAFPIFFPPAIWHRPKGQEEIMINQVAACMMYLGSELGYAPSSTAEKARADAVLLNAQDYIAEGRSSFHPVKNSMSYHDQKEEGDKTSKEFSQGRMKTFLYHFNKVVAKGNIEGPVAGGPSVTYADFALFHVLDATVAQFNSEVYNHAWDNLDVPELKQYYEWMKSRPNLQAYFKSERCVGKLCIMFFLLLLRCDL